LPKSAFDKEDTRARGFIARHGGLWQTEMDALDPDTLHDLFREAFDELWDVDAYEEQLEAEDELVREVLGEA
jgi:hypothetical protein